MTERELPTVSVMIPVKNGERHLPRCLESLEAQDYPPELVEIIVADGRSTDRSREIACSYGVTVLDNPKEKQVAGRNVAFAASGGELVALCDDDCVMEPGWLRNSLKYFADGTVGGVGGPTLLPEDQDGFGRAVGVFFQLGVWIAGSVQRQSVDAIREVEDIPGGNAIYRREALARVMPIDEDFLSGEDVELNFQVRRAGFRILSVPDVVVWHYKRQSPRELWRQMYRFAVGRVKNGRRDRRMIRMSHIFAGLSLPLALALGLTAAALGTKALGALAAGSALGAISLAGAGWWMTGSLAVALRVPLVLAVGAAAWSAGFLRELAWPYRGIAMR